jgi:type VI secretion system secreted protein Hcp
VRSLRQWRHLEEGLHPVRQAGGRQTADYFRIYLKDALITSVQLSGSNENPTESVSFAFQAWKSPTRPEKDDGSLDAAISKGYDLETC